MKERMGGYIIGRTIGSGTYSKVKVAYYLPVKPPEGHGEESTAEITPVVPTKGESEEASAKGSAQEPVDEDTSGRSLLAVKIINKRQATKEFVGRFLPREMAILRMVNHPHIIGVKDLIESGDCVYIFMDNCSLGDILEIIRREDALPEIRAKMYFRQLLSAVRYLHSYSIAHRDIKCENILLMSETHIKLGDFGFARFCYDEATKTPQLSETFCGSTAYAAPEVLQGNAYDPKKNDIWSVGIVLYVMVTAVMPFCDGDLNAMIQAQQKRKIFFPKKCSQEVRDVVRQAIY
ncbi:unnamed protein product [Cyprideis torosa]|uniref:Protein kinase domain-containing protein n=1 Tax=Cyprideis torosa TaxID=163714 RepID=A0A7R8WGY8_9CRUS|nr:unnamed protein product [Cyprideis torosa]CAG0893174.1 unnamed protein product [Cyprideis torosa]